jgi:outer membrane murein-binding lipoprotein Lpp
LQAQIDTLASSNSPGRGGSSSLGVARLRLLGTQQYRSDLIDAAVVTGAREAYVSELLSLGLWVVLQLFFRDGDRCVPRISEDSRTVVVGWSDRECEIARTYIITSDAPLVEWSLIHAHFHSHDASNFAIPVSPQRKRVASSMGFPEPPPKRPCSTDNDLNSQLAALQQQVLALSQKLTNAAPTNPLDARRQMYQATTPLDEGPRYTNNKRLARDRVADWLSGKSQLLPKLSDFFTAMNREDTFNPSSRSHILSILSYILTGLATPSAIFRTRNASLAKEVRELIAQLAQLGDDVASQSHVIQSLVHELNRTQSFSRASLMLSIGYQQMLRQRSTPSSPTPGTTSSTARSSSTTTSNRTSTKSSSRQSLYKCFYCKQPGCQYDKCPHRFDNSMMKAEWYCPEFNSHGSCSLTSRTCPKIHRCSKCGGSHKSTRCRSDVQ